MKDIRIKVGFNPVKAIRKTWGFNPQTRIKHSLKRYNRQKFKAGE